MGNLENCLNSNNQISGFDDPKSISQSFRVTSQHIKRRNEFSHSNVTLTMTNSGYPTNIESNSNRMILAVGGNNKPTQFIKYFLIYSFYMSKLDPNHKSNAEIKEQEKNAFKQFCSLIKVTHPNEVAEFEGKYNKQSRPFDRNQLILKDYFEKNYLRENVNRIPLESEDPFIIGQLELPINCLFKGIFEAYNQKQTKQKEVYIVALLGKKQKKVLQNLINKEDSFSFSIFMRGFTSEALALKKKKQIPDSILFRVSFYPLDKLEKSFDYGYYLHQTQNEDILKEGNLIFNIMNFFKVSKDSRPEEREYEIIYGSLAYAWNQANIKRISPESPEILKVFSICTATSNHLLTTQSCLFRIIKQKDDSIRVSEIILEKKESNPRQMNSLEKTNIIDNHIDDKNLKEALSIVAEDDQTPILKAKKIEIYYEMKNFDEVDTLLSTVEKQLPKIKKQDFKAYEIISYISARRKIMKKQHSQAKTQLQNLQEDMLSKYSQDYQFIGREVIKSLEECYARGEKKSFSGIDWDQYIEGVKLRSISKFN